MISFSFARSHISDLYSKVFFAPHGKENKFMRGQQVLTYIMIDTVRHMIKPSEQFNYRTVPSSKTECFL